MQQMKHFLPFLLRSKQLEVAEEAVMMPQSISFVMESSMTCLPISM
jgi:hypothetical protein